MAPGKEAVGAAKESMEYLGFVQIDLASLLNPSKLLSDPVQSPRLVLSDNITPRHNQHAPQHLKTLRKREAFWPRTSMLPPKDVKQCTITDI